MAAPLGVNAAPRLRLGKTALGGMQVLLPNILAYKSRSFGQILTKYFTPYTRVKFFGTKKQLFFLICVRYLGCNSNFANIKYFLILVTFTEYFINSYTRVEGVVQEVLFKVSCMLYSSYNIFS